MLLLFDILELILSSQYVQVHLFEESSYLFSNHVLQNISGMGVFLRFRKIYLKKICYTYFLLLKYTVCGGWCGLISIRKFSIGV